MLSEQDFAAWAKQIGLSDEALSVVAHIRRSNPVRRVGGGQTNVTGRYPSRKMGVTIQFESHRVELPTVYEGGISVGRTAPLSISGTLL